MDWIILVHAMGHLETAAELDEKYTTCWNLFRIVIMFLRMQQHTLRNELEQLEFDPLRLE